MESSYTAVPPIAFFGLDFVFYVSVYSHPRPTTNMILQTGTYSSNGIGRLIEHPSFKAPSSVFEFTTTMPQASEVNSTLSYFTVNFNSPNDPECFFTQRYIYPIPIITRRECVYIMIAL